MKESIHHEVLIGGVEKREIRICDYDPAWREKFERHAKIVGDALGDRAIRIEHVGSTAVEGLAAKPIVDILLVVENSGDESSYLPALEAAGYALRVREPDWHEHRMLRTPQLDVQIHIFSSGCSEIERLPTFRDWLRSHDDERQLYEATKRRLAAQEWPDMNAYATAKSEVIEGILAAARLGR
ncbi:MAG TPA: GrpB family protein [Pirellulales bacterium]|jgi:GrpB-like predicted nucleotidyltransferase (UPF0157 family)